MNKLDSFEGIVVFEICFFKMKGEGKVIKRNYDIGLFWGINGIYTIFFNKVVFIFLFSIMVINNIRWICGYYKLKLFISGVLFGCLR